MATAKIVIMVVVLLILYHVEAINFFDILELVTTPETLAAALIACIGQIVLAVSDSGFSCTLSPTQHRQITTLLFLHLSCIPTHRQSLNHNQHLCVGNQHLDNHKLRVGRMLRSFLIKSFANSGLRLNSSSNRESSGLGCLVHELCQSCPRLEK